MNYEEEKIMVNTEEELEEDDESLDELSEEEIEEIESKENNKGTNFFLKCRDNGVEWYTGENRVTATFSQRKCVTKIKKLAITRPEDVKIITEKKDGSVMAHLPLSYIKISPPRKVNISDERREQMRKNVKKMIEEGRWGVSRKEKSINETGTH